MKWLALTRRQFFCFSCIFCALVLLLGHDRWLSGVESVVDIP